MTNTERIPQINFLRGLALVMVIYQHTFAAFINQKLGTTWFLDNGWIGVNLFFILSGFVLFKPYIEGKRSFDEPGSIKKFYKARFGRLYPLFFFNIVIVVAIFYGTDPKYLTSAFLTLTTLSMFTVSNFIPIINGLLWSLVIEIWFSIVFPFVVILIKRFGLKKVLVTIMITALLIRLVGTNFQYIYLDINPIKDFFMARIDDFLLGFFIVYIYTNFKEKLTTIRKYNFGILFISGASLLAGVFLYELVEHFKVPSYFLAFVNSFLQLGFVLLIFVAINSKGILEKVFKFYPLRVIGVMCYSLYIWHISVIVLVLPEISIRNIILYLIFLSAIAFITFRYIEYRKYSVKEILSTI